MTRPLPRVEVEYRHAFGVGDPWRAVPPNPFRDAWRSKDCQSHPVKVRCALLGPTKRQRCAVRWKTRDVDLLGQTKTHWTRWTIPYAGHGGSWGSLAWFRSSPPEVCRQSRGVCEGE